MIINLLLKIKVRLESRFNGFRYLLQLHLNEMEQPMKVGWQACAKAHFSCPLVPNDDNIVFPLTT